MIINAANIDLVFHGFKNVFNKAFEGAPAHYQKIAMVVPSATRDETYGWLGSMPQIREWIGERIVCNLTAHSYTIANRDFESTIKVNRNDIADDRYGVFSPIISEMGRVAAHHPDKLIFELLSSGFSSLCYDGQYFFDADHPVLVNGREESTSNMQPGDGPAWYLLDTSR